MPNEKINISGPWITQKEIDYVNDAVKNAWYSNAYMYHEKFENAFADYLDREYAIALPSCTSAIHLALLAMDIKDGDEVIVPDITWIASAAPVTYIGAIPIFADIDERTWCLSPESFKKSITSKTKAVIAVDLYGNMADMDRIINIAKEHNIKVIEDSAQAVGATYKGKKAGSFGHASVFSFHGSKTLTTGEGGMLLTDDENIYKKAKIYADHGKDPDGKAFWNIDIGYKYKMSSMQAALGLAQIERIDELIRKKREIFSWYKEELSNVEGIEINYELPETKSTYWMVNILWDSLLFNLTKEDMIIRLKDENIDSRPVFYPLSMLPAYKEYLKDKDYSITNTVAYRISPFAVNLPSGMGLTREKVKRVCRTVKEILNEVKGKVRI